MLKKLLIMTLAFMIVLTMGTASANVHDANMQVLNLNEDNIKDNSASESGNKQYTITEAAGPIEQIIEKEEKRMIDPIKPMIAITYDDGPSVYTPEILDVLKENNSVATFFVLGLNVYNNDNILNRMLTEGNQIGNHTYNHKNITTISNEELYKQVQGTDDLIYMATGYTPTLMRPPYGSTNRETNKNIAKPLIHWSIDTRDWESKNVEMIKNSILENVKDGDIILMHDIYDSTVEATKIVIPELINRGYQLVTIDELVEYRGATLSAGEQYYNMYK